MGTLVFQATAGGSFNFVGPNIAGTVSLTLPSADGTSGQFLKTDGAGTLSFATASTAPGGSTTQVQYNNAGAFAGITGATTNGTALTLVAPVLGTPASGVVTNLTGTASININGTVGATTPTTVVATTVKASTTMGVGAATPSASGAGITFPATQSASTDVNTLDDYEEGTWTPVLSSSGDITTTLNIQKAVYTKIGNYVYCICSFQIATISGTSGYLQITGLPFTAVTGNGTILLMRGYCESAFPNTYGATGYGSGGTTVYTGGTISAISAGNYNYMAITYLV